MTNEVLLFLIHEVFVSGRSVMKCYDFYRNFTITFVLRHLLSNFTWNEVRKPDFYDKSRCCTISLCNTINRTLFVILRHNIWEWQPVRVARRSPLRSPVSVFAAGSNALSRQSSFMLGAEHRTNKIKNERSESIFMVPVGRAHTCSLLCMCCAHFRY